MRMLGMSKGTLIKPMPSSNGASCFGIGSEDRGDTGRNAAMQPGDRDFALRIQAGFQMLDRNRVKEVVVQIVVASPDDLDRLAVHRLRQQRRLDGEVGLGLAPEAAAEQGHVHRDVRRRDMPRCFATSSRVTCGA